MQFESITCPACSSLNIKKNGINKQRKQRYRCKRCGKQFIVKYSYRAYLKHIRELIVPMSLNGSGIRDTARVLRVSATTVIRGCSAGIHFIVNYDSDRGGSVLCRRSNSKFDSSGRSHKFKITITGILLTNRIAKIFLVM